VTDDKIELVARFFWERSGKFRWSDLSGDLKESALDCVRNLDADMVERFYDAIEFGRKLGEER